MSYISAAALNRAAATPAPAIDAFTLPGDIPDAPGEASAADARELTSGTPSEDWRARGLAHPAGRGWEVVTPARDETSAYTSLAAELLAEPEEERSVFTRALQVQFLHALAACGAVRRASASVGLSYRTVYRERRASRPFALAWDAALIAARAVHADVLAARAIDGVEEVVWFRGEEVGRRVRYDSRLLLAHLARLDRLTEDARTRAWGEDFEGALDRFAAGIDDPAPTCPDCDAPLPLVPALAHGAGEGEGESTPATFSAGQCDKCDMPSAKAAAKRAARAAEAAAVPPCPECGGACLDPDPVVADTECPVFEERIEAMLAAYPDDANFPGEIDPDDVAPIALAQLAAFEAGVARWWWVVPGPDGETGARGERWHFHEEDAQGSRCAD